MPERHRTAACKQHRRLAMTDIGTSIISVARIAACAGLMLGACVTPARGEANGLALSPPLGWTTWSSLQTTLDAESVKAIARIQAASLKSSGYIYVNVDGGWYANPDAVVDAYGRWVADADKFPGGMAALGDYIHSLGLKFGIYVTPGIPALAVWTNKPIEGTPYHAPDIAIITRRQDTYLGGTMYYIDYSLPGSQEFINSWANLFASWGVDYLKLDAVGDWNVPDIAAWSAALGQTGRPMHLQLSNNLNPSSAATWREHSNGWRISPDIEAYNGVSLTSWEHVALRFHLAPRWLGAGASGGWNDLDSLIVGGPHSGLTLDERRTMMTFWALSASPLIIGDDLRTLDAFGLSLLTNQAVIGINQSGVVAAPLNTAAPQQVWTALQPDGSYAVGLFNLSESPALVTASWADLGFAGSAALTDVWSDTQMGPFSGGFSAELSPHASMLLRVRPFAPVQQILADHGVVNAWAFLGASPVSARGVRAQYLGFGSGITFPHVNVSDGGLYNITVNYINGAAAARAATLAVNGFSIPIVFAGAGDWSEDTTNQGLTRTVYLRPGQNVISFSNPDGWSADVIGITLQSFTPSVTTYYKVISAATGRVLDNAFGSTAAGTPVIQWPDSGAAHQQWYLFSHSDAAATFANHLSGYVLEVSHLYPYPGVPVDQYPYHGGSNQRWRMVHAGLGAFVLVNQLNGLVIYASADWGGAKADQRPSTGAVQEHWMIVPVMSQEASWLRY
jgi:alpha-galactosidase